MAEATSRRQFLAKGAQGAAGAACAGLAWFTVLRGEAHAAPFALRPPGAMPERDFLGLCVKCGQCVRACAPGTLRLATAASGIPPGTPHFVPREEPCQLCPDVDCAKACPTGALDRGLASIEKARMGLAVVDAENCLSWQGLRCEVCYRICPMKGKAITIDPHPRGISRHAVFVPVIHGEACTGCGLCEKACPTDVASVRVLQPSLVQGKIGEHFRRPVTTHDVAPGEPPAASPAVPKPAAKAKAGEPGSRKALDYLNQGVENL
jgi:ferredoxin-type protein NapG